MFSVIRRRFTSANVTMTLALVFAMSGGAYAASKFVITSTKQIKPSVLKQLQGKAGPAGPAGANGATGAQGPQGPAGVNGKDGTNGVDGKDGTNGVNGTSVTSKEKATGAIGPCPEGGSEFTAAESKKTYACSGKEGSPWMAGGTLPHNATERGVWSAVAMPAPDVLAEFAGVDASISFNLPVASIPTVHFIEPGEEGSGGGCPVGSSVENPEAESGNLCIFMGEESVNVLSIEGKMVVYPHPPPGKKIQAGGANTSGTILSVFAQEEAKGVQASGTWAVMG